MKGQPRNGRPRRALLLLLFGFFLLLFPLLDWLERKDPVSFVPATPLDGTRGALAEEWLFLSDARRFVPARASYTVRASDLGREMTLFMMSYGLLPRAAPIPSSYHGNPERWRGADAEYVIAFQCEMPEQKDCRIVARVAGGCVLRRGVGQ